MLHQLALYGIEGQRRPASRSGVFRTGIGDMAGSGDGGGTRAEAVPSRHGEPLDIRGLLWLVMSEQEPEAGMAIENYIRKRYSIYRRRSYVGIELLLFGEHARIKNVPPGSGGTPSPATGEAG